MNCTGRSVPAHACDLVADEPASYHDHPGAGATGAARRRGRGRDAHRREPGHRHPHRRRAGPRPRDRGGPAQRQGRPNRHMQQAGKQVAMVGDGVNGPSSRQRCVVRSPRRWLVDARWSSSGATFRAGGPVVTGCYSSARAGSIYPAWAASIRATWRPSAVFRSKLGDRKYSKRTPGTSVTHSGGDRARSSHHLGPDQAVIPSSRMQVMRMLLVARGKGCARSSGQHARVTAPYLLTTQHGRGLYPFVSLVIGAGLSSAALRASDSSINGGGAASYPSEQPCSATCSTTACQIASRSRSPTP